MELAYTLNGNAPVIRRYQIGITSNTVGVPYTIPAANTPGVVIATTTGATDMVGCNIGCKFASARFPASLVPNRDANFCGRTHP